MNDEGKGRTAELYGTNPNNPSIGGILEAVPWNIRHKAMLTISQDVVKYRATPVWGSETGPCLVESPLSSNSGARQQSLGARLLMEATRPRK